MKTKTANINFCVYVFYQIAHNRAIRPCHPFYSEIKELGRNPVSKHQIQPEYGDEQADAGRDG